MAGKDELLVSVPTMRRRSAPNVSSQTDPGPSSSRKTQAHVEDVGHDTIDEIRPRETGVLPNAKRGSLFDLKSAERPNSKGAVNLLLAPELKARLDAANYASKVPRVQIVIAALDEYLEKNGF